jgi:2'-5' RNA ligase
MLFIAVSIPDHVATVLQTTIDSFGSQLDERVPREKWHITLVWLGPASAKATAGKEVWLAKVTQPLSQSFLPTISLRYAGPAYAKASVGKGGAQRRQLWVYAQITPALINLRQQLLARLQRAGVPVPHANRPWVPHIRLGDFSDEQPTTLADRLLPATTFVPTAAQLLRDYVIEGTIPFA